MSIKLIAIDMDETFLRSDKSYDRERFEAIFAELKRRDIILLVASGNSYHQLVEQFDESILPDLYFAGDNGSFIVKDQNVLETCGMERDLYLEIVDFIQEHLGNSYFVSTGMESYILNNSPIYDEAKIYNGILHVINDYREIPKDKVAYKISIHNETDDSLADNKIFTKEINERFPEVFSVTSGNVFIDIINKDSGKGHAVKYLQNKYDISIDETMVFGDSMNDLSMVPRAKYSFAMANSDPDFMKHCKFKIGTNNEQAVLDTIEAFLSGELNLELKENT